MAGPNGSVADPGDTGGSIRTLAQLRHWVPSRWTPPVLNGLALVAGIIEAAVIAGVAALAATIAQGDDAIVLSVGVVSIDAPITRALATLSVATVAMVALLVVHGYLAARLAAETLTHARTRLVREYLDSPYEVQRSYLQAQLHELVVVYAMRLTQATTAIIGAASQALAFLAMVGVAFLADPASAGTLLVLALVFAVLFRPLMQVTKRAGATHVEAQTVVAVHVGEITDLLAEVRVFGARDGMRKRLSRGVDTTARALQVASFAKALMPTLYLGAVVGALLLGVFVLHNLGTFDVTTIGAVVLLTLRGMRYSQGALSQAQAAVEQSRNVSLVLQASEKFRSASTDDSGDPLERIDVLTFDEVSYRYPNSTEGVESISISCERGEVVGIVGHSGAGKSTFAELALGLRHPTSGRILVNGHLRENYREHSWFARVAYVGQEPRLIAGDVATNVKFFRDVDDEAVEFAIESASLTDDNERWGGNQGRDVGSGGRDISGGQRQRIAIARALAGDPDLIVMDEPTSALDDASEAKIRAAIRNASQHALVIVIAHRQSTLEVCDRVIEFAEGTAAEAPVEAVADLSVE